MTGVALRRSVERGTLFGAERWVKRTAAALGLESSLNPPARPPSSSWTGTTSGTMGRRERRFTAVRRQWIARSAGRRYSGLNHGTLQHRPPARSRRSTRVRQSWPLNGSRFESRLASTWPATSRVIRRGSNIAVIGRQSKFSRPINRYPSHDPDARRDRFPRRVLP